MPPGLPGPVVQKLKLKEVPQGVTVRITAVRVVPPNPPPSPGWKVKFTLANNTVVGNNAAGSTAPHFPVNVLPGSRSGSIGTVQFDASSPGNGGSVDITLSIETQRTVNNHTTTSVVPGFIKVAAGAWKKFERPDHTSVSLSVNGAPATVEPTPVPKTVVTQPKEMSLSVIEANGTLRLIHNVGFEI